MNASAAGGVRGRRLALVVVWCVLFGLVAAGAAGLAVALSLRGRWVVADALTCLDDELVPVQATVNGSSKHWVDVEYYPTTPDYTPVYVTKRLNAAHADVSGYHLGDDIELMASPRDPQHLVGLLDELAVKKSLHGPVPGVIPAAAVAVAGLLLAVLGPLFGSRLLRKLAAARARRRGAAEPTAATA